MALVSSTWIFVEKGNTFCYWPLYLKSTLSREKAVINHIKLDLSKCTKCAVLIKHNYSDYTKANAKLRCLEEQSDNSSVPESFQRTKKSIRNTNFIYSENDDDEFEIPDPPHFSATPSSQVDCSATPSSQVDGSASQSSQVKILKGGKPGGTSCVEKEMETNKYCSNATDSMTTLNKQSFLKARTNAQSNVKPRVKPISTCMCSGSDNLTATDDDELEDNNYSLPKHELKKMKMLKQLVRDVKELKMDMQVVLKATNLKSFTDLELLHEQLGFDSYESLQMFDTKLKADKEYYIKLSNSLALFGGKDTSEHCRKIMAYLIKHNLALCINWVGANNKGSFEKLENILQLIRDAIRRNPLCSQSTNGEIDRAIKNWIKNAPDREGGRANRKKIVNLQVND